MTGNPTSTTTSAFSSKQKAGAMDRGKIDYLKH